MWTRSDPYTARAASVPAPCTQAGAEGRGWCLTLLLVHRCEAAGDILVQFVAMIPVIGQRRVDLAQREVRELEVQFFRAPAVRGLRSDEFDDLHRRAGDAGHTAGVQDDMLIAGFGKGHGTSPV